MIGLGRRWSHSSPGRLGERDGGWGGSCRRSRRWPSRLIVGRLRGSPAGIQITMATITPTASSAAMSPPAMAPPFTPPPEPFETSSVVLPTHTHKTRKPCGGPSEREERDTYRHSSSGHRPVSVLGDNCRQNCHSCLYTCANSLHYYPNTH